MLVNELATEDERIDFFKRVPPSLCKFRTWSDDNHKRLITDQELFFSSPKRFNDPYDCGLPFKQHPHNSDPVVIKVMLERSAPRLFPDLLDNPKALEEKCAKQILLIQQNPESWFEMNWDLTPETMSKTFGVLSLTPHPLNYLMWSHYGDCHRGFCVQFNTRGLVESLGGHFERVNYAKDLPFISITDTIDNELLTKLIYTKSDIWHYEDEYRLSRIYKSDFAENFDPESLEAIYFGYNMTTEDQMSIIDIASKSYSKTQFYKMELDKNEFKLNAGQIVLL